MTTQQATKKYGTANVTGAGYLVKIKLPYPMRIAWDLDSSVNTMMCHKLVADNFTAVFNELLATYGYDDSLSKFLAGSKSIAIPHECMDKAFPPLIFL